MDPTNTTPTEPNVNPMPPTRLNGETATEMPVGAATTVNADIANAALNPPTNPVVTPTNGVAQPIVADGTTMNPTPQNAQPMPAPAQPTSAPAQPMPNAISSAPTTPGMAAPGVATMPMNQMFQTQPAAGQANVFSETTAIAVPEGPKAPDPVEEELKAPLKAAAPVPGSIGSAVSGPESTSLNPPQSVAFTDPANNPMAANTNITPTGKKPSILDKIMTKTKMTKSTLMLLSIVAGLIVLVLIVVLVLVATGNI